MSTTPVPSDFADVLRLFALREGQNVSAEPYGNGHINDTYVAVRTDKDGGRRRYIAQRINHTIFKNVPALMDNIDRVTKHIGAKDRAANPGVPSRALTLIPALDGKPYAQDAQGGYWRVYDFIEGSHTVDRVTSEGEAREAAVAFGAFQALLADLPGERLQETIPNFHHTRSRFENLRRAVNEDKMGRVKEARPEIDFAFAREADADVLIDLLAKKQISERVTHNDTKINNVMLDDSTGRAVAVIDLDTVMPGLPLHDFGDLVRTSACSAAEDDPNPANMHLVLPYYRALLEGYLSSEVGGVLNATERELLWFGGKMMSYEVGIRFLTDFLQGDVYFKTKHPRHNLERSRTQLALVKSIEDNQGEMARMLDDVFKGK